VVIKGFKYRIYPTEEQKVFLSKQFGATRFAYNYFLANRKSEYENNKRTLCENDDSKLLTQLKTVDGYEWLNDVNAQSLQAVLKNLSKAYSRFFKHQSKFPRFHKRSSNQCVKIPQAFKVKNKKLFIPKLKAGIKIVVHKSKPLPAEQICCYISKTPTDKYYVSFNCKVDVRPLKYLDNAEVGIDLGLKSLLITSDGEAIENKHFYREAEKKLAYEQRKLSKKKQGSNNRRKQKKVVAKVHEKIHNKRLDYIHKITHRIVNENQVIILESLAVKNMIKNHCLAKGISDAAWGELSRQLRYKSDWFWRTFHQIDRFYPSSKTCNDCGFILDSLPLNIREWTCPICDSYHDRDVNAAMNIRDRGLQELEDLEEARIAEEERLKAIEAKKEVLKTSGCGSQQSDDKQKHVEASGKNTESMKHEAPVFRQG
jgi:putative transposase